MILMHKTDVGTLGAYRCFEGGEDNRHDEGIAVGVLTREPGTMTFVQPVAKLINHDGRMQLVVFDDLLNEKKISISHTNSIQ